MEAARDHRRATAERNAEAILDAVVAIAERGELVTIAAVAAQSGLSRVTVYAHYDTLEKLLEATVERAARHAAEAADAVVDAPPLEALRGFVDSGWAEVERHDAVARVAAQQLPSEARTRAHEAAMVPVRELIERGQREGEVRSDVPAAWLTNVFFALLHAAADEVRAGRMDAADAPAVVGSTVERALAASLP
jgi:TetR/AcrR family transcriptional regulator, mexCD-oprJ operon repressor